MSLLTFRELVDANRSRMYAHNDGCSADWSILEWAGAMCGEAGEAANVAKKIVRGDTKHPPEYYHECLAQEMADTIIYLGCMAARMNIDLGQAVRDKFNAVSIKYGDPERL